VGLGPVFTRAREGFTRYLALLLRPLFAAALVVRCMYFAVVS
jgi:hypothetical protein